MKWLEALDDFTRVVIIEFAFFVAVVLIIIVAFFILNAVHNRKR